MDEKEERETVYLHEPDLHTYDNEVPLSLGSNQLLMFTGIKFTFEENQK
jgi:hypothetical protein